MTNIFDTHRNLTQTYLLYGDLSDNIVCGDLVVRSFEQYLVTVLKSRGYRNILFFAEGVNGAYTLDPVSARFFFKDANQGIPLPTADSVKKSSDSAIAATPSDNPAGKPAVSLPQTASEGTRLGSIVGRSSRYRPGDDPKRSATSNTDATPESRKVAPKQIVYAKRNLEAPFFTQLIESLMPDPNNRIAVIIHNIFTTNITAEIRPLLDHILGGWEHLAGKNICILLAPQTGRSETELMKRLGELRLGPKFIQHSDSQTSELNPRCCYKVGKPDADEIKNLLRRLSIIGTPQKRHRFQFSYQNLDSIADEILYCAGNTTVNGIPKDGINQIQPKLEEFLDCNSDCVVEINADVVRSIWKMPSTVSSKPHRTEAPQGGKPDWTVCRFQTKEETIVTEAKPFEKVLEELDKLIGLDGVKKMIKKQMSKIKNDHRRVALLGIPPVDTSLHMVFQGPPGTGKTTVARLVGELYHSLGLLRRGHLVETSGKDLIADHVGGSAKETEKCINEALGGVLFIDEAYSLNDGTEFGETAVSTLVQGMENHREDLVVIAAGYPEEMKEFVESNDGLESRFRTYIDFAPYSLDELLQILDGMCSKHHYVLTPEARKMAHKELKDEMREEHFGNGRAVRNLFEKAIENQASRIVDKQVTAEELQQIVAEDIPIVLKGNAQKDIETLYNELDQMVGLQAVKEEIRTQMDLVAFNRALASEGKPAQEVSLHLVFQGPPGTGKTTVARKVGELYHSMGLLRKGHVVETSGKDMIAGYVGQSAGKTEECIKSAMGGVLFIDEAYSITDNANYGQDVISTLVQAMENHRDDLVVIAAGYPGKMKEFVSFNDGLKDRFPTYIDFEPYTLDELLQILDGMCSKGGYELTQEAREAAGKKLASEMKERGFGNGRAVRNLFEKMVKRIAGRYARTHELTTTFLACDVPTR